MRTVVTLVCAPILAVGAGVALTACSLDNGSGAGKAGSTAAAIVAPPRPGVTITSPARASFLLPGQVAVAGRATASPRSGASVAAVQVNGTPVPVAPDGSFQTIITVDRGLNLIRAVATDASGLTGSTAIGVLAGDWKPMQDFSDNAVACRINDPALDGIEKIMEEAIAAIDLWSLGASPIYSASWFIFSVEAFVRQIRYAGVTVDMDSRPDGLHMVAALAQPLIDLDVVVNLGGGPFPPEPVSVAADRAEVRGRIVPAIAADGTIDMRVEDVNVDLPGLRVLVTSNAIQLIESLLRSITRRIVEDRVQLALARLRPVLGPVPIALNGNQVVVDVRGNASRFEDTGFDLLLKVNSTPAAFSPRGLAAPGSFSTAGATPPLTTTSGLQITIDDDGLNRVAHGFWAAGGLVFDMAQMITATSTSTSTSAGGGTGLQFQQLKAADVLAILPELAGVLPPTAPMNIVAEAHLPPIFRTSAPPDYLSLEAGEIMISLQFDRGNGWETALKVAAHLTASVNLGIDRDGLWLNTATTPRFDFDVVEEPLGDVDDRRVEVALGLLLTSGVPYYFNKASVRVPLPYVNHLSFFNAQVFADGPAQDHVTLLSNLSR